MDWAPNLDFSFGEEAADTVFTWTIKNFDLCHHSPSKPLKSPDFGIYAWQTPRFHIMLYPRGVNQNNAGYVSIYVVKSNNEVKDVKYSCELGIVTTRCKRSLLRFKSSLLLGHGRGLATFLDRKQLLSTDRDSMLPDGNLTLYCELSVKEPRSVIDGQACHEEGLRELSAAFENVFETGQHTDAVLQTTGKTFKVHKAMLEARFLNLAEKTDSSLTSMDEQAVCALLQYIYTGKLNKNRMQLFDLVSSCSLPSHLKSLLAVRCRHIQAETSIARKDISFRWTVRHFSSLKPDEVLRYSMFGNDIHRWTWLEISLAVSNDEATADDLLFSINRYSQECKRIICKITVLDRSETFEHVFEHKENFWKIPAFVKKSDIAGEHPADHEVSFDFEVSLSDGSSTSDVTAANFAEYSSSASEIAEDLVSFQNDLEMLLKGARHTDATMTCGGKTFPCHKFVLCARSTVFSEMFDGEHPYNALHPITVEDVDPSVVESMLHHIYTGKIDQDLVDIKYAIGLYCLANKYKLTGLRRDSMRLIKSEVSVDTIGEILITADAWNDAELKECVYTFVCTFPQLVTKSSLWQDVLKLRNDLALEILNRTLVCLASGNTEEKAMEENSNDIMF